MGGVGIVALAVMMSGCAQAHGQIPASMASVQMMPAATLKPVPTPRLQAEQLRDS